MNSTDEQPSDGEQGSRCALCTRGIEAFDKNAVALVVSRSEAMSYDEERLFHETQEFDFCDLGHANEYLARNPIRDEWTNSEIDDAALSTFESIGCGLVALILLAALITGLVVGGQAIWGLVA